MEDASLREISRPISLCLGKRRQNPRSGFRKIAKIRRTTEAGGYTGHLAAAAEAADLAPAGIPRAGRAFPSAAPTTANDPGARPSESRMKD